MKVTKNTIAPELFPFLCPLCCLSFDLRLLITTCMGILKLFVK